MDLPRDTVAAQLPPRTRTSEDLRQRQRDRLSPRGRFSNRLPSPARAVDALNDAEGAALSPAPRPQNSGNQAADSVEKGQMQQGVWKQRSVRRQARIAAAEDKHDITPDGGSASREGRQFTVSNVGNNGRIYLRPTIRPANQRYPQPSFSFPTTPPKSADLDALATQRQDEEGQNHSLWTPTRSPSAPNNSCPLKSPDRSPHQRAQSYSTVDDQHLQANDDAGAFKVVIARPGLSRAATADGLPTLEVPIPSYKLGTPRFSLRGTAFWRGSSHTTFTVEEACSSVLSPRESPSSRFTQGLSRRHSLASHHHLTAAVAADQQKLPPVSDSGLAKPHKAIVPEMFDALTFQPACDHPSVVRYTASGAIKAATPERIVAEITSPTFVDYDLLSDFFLTFRAFLHTADLLQMLVARLKWAIARGDEVGTVVRVRTFVALRHWILNYFLDDYVIDYDLRKMFCELLNEFVGTLSDSAADMKVPLKILAELKKCWRRVSGVYWDGRAFDAERGSEEPIHPGGVAGSRNPDLDPTFWERHPTEAPRLDGIIEPEFLGSSTMSAGNHFFADVSRAGYIDSILANPDTARSTEDGALGEHGRSMSQCSILSEEIGSCSLPYRPRVLGSSRAKGPHPVPASSVYESSPLVAMTPAALTGKRVRPATAPKRSASFSDSTRHRRKQQHAQQQPLPVQKVRYKSTDLLLALPYAGSLVRGNMFPPGQPFVDIVASSPAEPNRDTTLFARTPAMKGPSAMSGPGMKRLLGSVRRALSSRNGTVPNSSPTQGSFPHIPPIGVRGATINRLPGTAVVPQAVRSTGARTAMRIDLLGAEIAEHFKQAVQEDAEAEAEAAKRQTSEQESVRSGNHNNVLHYSEMQPDTTVDPTRASHHFALDTTEVSDTSKHVVIIDDTLVEHAEPLDYSMVSGTEPPTTIPDDISDAYRNTSSGPTPPKTPPEATLGTPRRSSQLLGTHTHNRTNTLSTDDTPSLIVDSRESNDDDRSPSHRPVTRAALRSSFAGNKSMSIRRYASYNSGYSRGMSERSFDATTTFSEEGDASKVPPASRPIRVLRRKPGGDLKAATNVGDLSANSLHRPMSTGSLMTYSESVRSSYLLAGDESRYANATIDEDYSENPRPFSLGALAEAKPRSTTSLFSTHSSQPVMRPSFEKEAQYLAAIPDDVDDDGGVESALAKLEGKFEQRRSETAVRNMSHMHNVANTRSFGQTGFSYPQPQPFDVSTLTLGEEKIDEEEERRKYRHGQVADKTPAVVAGAYRPPVPTAQMGGVQLKPTVYQPTGMRASYAQRRVDSWGRDLEAPPTWRPEDADGLYLRRQTQDWSHRSVFFGASTEHVGNQDSPDQKSYDFVEETDSLKRIPRGATFPSNHNAEQSVLYDDMEDNGSDLSSEMSLEVISKVEYTEHDSVDTQTFPPIRPGTVIKEMALPSYPLRRPPSPPMTMVQALRLSPDLANAGNQQRGHRGPLPPTPEETPGMKFTKYGRAGSGHDIPTLDPLEAHGLEEPSRKTSAHLPFILAFDSQVLAQQFTLVEKDALNEIDWKDLIEMRWKDTSTDSRSWVDFLRTSEPRGVEVVIARFNLMSKWTVSEIVLTQDLEERARSIIKYIHIAAHCRKYRNFATMTQLTIALTTKDVSRLTQTWAHVPASDKQTLKDLEALISPTSNFYNIRAEMEGAGAGQGCIPFVGIYTHDLIINSERPSQIASTPSTEPLVNFERSRTDARIVKNLLRLLEASQLYRFLPIEGVTERCLWMAALTDSEIEKYGRMIEA